MLPVASLRAAFEKALLNAATCHSQRSALWKQCWAVNRRVPALLVQVPGQAVLLLLLQLGPACGSSAEHLMERKWAELRCTPEDLLLPASLSTEAAAALSRWSSQGRRPTSMKPSARTQGQLV